jgi:hypothetical protein
MLIILELYTIVSSGYLKFRIYMVTILHVDGPQQNLEAGNMRFISVIEFEQRLELWAH